VEIGGGSTQVAFCQGDKIFKSVSLPLGTGRLIALEDLSYPLKPFQIDHIKEHVQHTIETCRSFGVVARVVASGGVARGFLRALHPDGERTLAIEELDYLAWAAARLSVEKICARFDVKQKRAMTLVPGTLILTSLMRLFLQREVLVSEFGVREGALLRMFEGRITPCRL
jgi:exopolyphosphatase/guanosine-5'-triphosphate,3'-diphosphate pyrophosphatase